MSYDDIAPSPHLLLVKSYHDNLRAHECEATDGNTKRKIFVDLFVDGNLPRDLDPKALIGKTVSVEYTHGYLWIAETVNVLPDDGEKL